MTAYSTPQQQNNPLKASNFMEKIALCMCVPKNGVPLARLSISSFDRYVKHSINLYFTVNDPNDEIALRQLYPKSHITFVKPKIIQSNFRFHKSDMTFGV